MEVPGSATMAPLMVLNIQKSSSSSSSPSSSPMIERESNIEDRIDDCDMYDNDEDVDNVLPSELEVSELNIKLVGVKEDTKGGKAGTGVNSCSGD